ncbi:MAG: hypothetical protein NT155_03675 [Candidatus Staskawiczbacteria bacterium]|nr:hypothetical protein [Candidatus Staskawiczbacteria bacterium]
MKLFIIRVLLRLLHIELSPIDAKRVKMFLWTAYPQQGFQDYIKERDMSILQEMGNGLTREDYLIKLGQRIEIGMLKSQSKVSFERIERERQDKIEAMKIQAEKRAKEAKKEQLKKGEDTENKTD